MMKNKRIWRKKQIKLKKLRKAEKRKEKEKPKKKKPENRRKKRGNPSFFFFLRQTREPEWAREPEQVASDEKKTGRPNTDARERSFRWRERDMAPARWELVQLLKLIFLIILTLF